MARTADLLALGHRHLVRTHAITEQPPVIAKALGTKVWDVDGREYIDFVSGQVCSTLGHNHPRIVEAIDEACRKVIHASGWLLNEDSILFAQALTNLLPATLSKVLCKSGGGEANEVALHMAKVHTGNWEVLAPDRSYFGATAAARSSTYLYGHNRHGPGLHGTYAMPAPYAYRCPLRHCEGSCDSSCLEQGFEMFDSQSEGYPAAVIVEPILGGGGVLEPPNEYFRLLEKRARERGMLIIFDEALTGLGRAGSMFGFEYVGVVPDILVLSKTIGGGVPLSVAVTSSEMEEDLFGKGFMHGSSHANDPLPARVGLAVLQVLVEEDLAAKAATKGEYIRRTLKEMAGRHELIGDVRGRGLLLGLELVRDRATKEPAFGEVARFNEICLEHGLLLDQMRPGGRSSIIRMAPPLTISQTDIDRALTIMDEALSVVSGMRSN